MQAMGEVTTVGKASSNFASLRTVVPMPIVRQWNLKEGDKLDWSWEVRSNEMFVVIRRVGKTTDSSHSIVLERGKGRKKK
jgi:bifunctional DNA-binding transcriptional regulator/antitoxin component of YhaV-PrlF toxin-antitoxin module